MNDETKMPEPVPSEIPEAKEDEGDPAPELKLVPIEDLDKVEKLLDVARNTIDMPNLPNIKASCMQELKAIDDSMNEAVLEAQEAYRVELAEWEAKRAEEQRARDKETRLAAKKAEEERKRQLDEQGYDPDAPHTLAGVPRDTRAQPIDPTGPSTVYPSQDPRNPQVRPENGTIERRL